LSQIGAAIFGEQMRPAHEAMGALGRAYLNVTLHRTVDPEYVKKVVEILKRAAGELEALTG
jgi:hypothetical protein